MGGFALKKCTGVSFIERTHEIPPPVGNPDEKS